MAERQVFRQIYLSSRTKFHQCHHYFDRYIPRYWINSWEKDPHAFHKHKWRAAQRRKRQRWGSAVGLDRPHGSDNLQDPYFLNGSELAIEAQRAVEKGDRNPEFWRQVIERARTLRDVTSVRDLCALVDSLVTVNVRNTDLLKLLTREFMDDMSKMSPEELALMLNAYAHFQCKSDDLLNASVNHLEALLKNDDAFPAASLALILRSLRRLDVPLATRDGGALLNQCRALCHEFSWTSPAFASSDEVAMAYEGIEDPIQVDSTVSKLPPWADQGSLQSTATLLVSHGSHVSISQNLLARLVHKLEGDEGLGLHGAHTLSDERRSFPERPTTPLSPLWNGSIGSSSASTLRPDAHFTGDSRSSFEERQKIEDDFEIHADWDDQGERDGSTREEKWAKEAYRFQWYDPLTRQLRSQKAIRSSAFDPSAVRRRHNTGRITATALNALFQHAEIVEANDDYKAIARKFVDKSTKMIPTVAKNLAAEDLISVVRTWTHYNVQDAQAWRPVSLELIRKFVHLDGADIKVIRQAMWRWPEIPEAILLKRSIKRWGERKLQSTKKKGPDNKEDILMTNGKHEKA